VSITLYISIANNFHYGAVRPTRLGTSSREDSYAHKSHLKQQNSTNSVRTTNGCQSQMCVSLSENEVGPTEFLLGVHDPYSNFSQFLLSTRKNHSRSPTLLSRSLRRPLLSSRVMLSLQGSTISSNIVSI